jgi:NAD+ synthetase
MPASFSSAGSVEDSYELAKNLKMSCETLDISEMHGLFRSSLGYGKDFEEGSLIDQNIQPRIRMIMLMAKAEFHGGLVLNTSNKSESFLGYSTLYGDMSGGLAPIADLYKTEIFYLCQNFYQRAIPENTQVKPPSAELASGQKDTDSLPPYDILDPQIRQFVEEGKEISRDLMVKSARVEFKRKQSPIIIKISRKAFGSGRRLPILQGWLK